MSQHMNARELNKYLFVKHRQSIVAVHQSLYYFNLLNQLNCDGDDDNCYLACSANCNRLCHMYLCMGLLYSYSLSTLSSIIGAPQGENTNFLGPNLGQ